MSDAHYLQGVDQYLKDMKVSFRSACDRMATERQLPRKHEVEVCGILHPAAVKSQEQYAVIMQTLEEAERAIAAEKQKVIALQQELEKTRDAVQAAQFYWEACSQKSQVESKVIEQDLLTTNAQLLTRVSLLECELQELKKV